MKSYIKHIPLISFICILLISCTSSTNNPLSDVAPIESKIIVRLIKEGTGHKPTDGVVAKNQNEIIIGPESDQNAAAVFDYYENDVLVTQDVQWSTVMQNGESLPANLHIHKHADSYIVLVNLDYNEKTDITLIVKLSKDDKLVVQKEVTVKKRVSPIKKTIEAFDENDIMVNANNKIEINPNTTDNNTYTFKYVVEGRPNTQNVSWTYTNIYDEEIELPVGLSFKDSTPPLTGFYTFTIDPSKYSITSKLEIVVVLKQDKLRLEKALTIFPKSSI